MNREIWFPVLVPCCVRNCLGLNSQGEILVGSKLMSNQTNVVTSGLVLRGADDQQLSQIIFCVCVCSCASKRRN